MLAPEQVLVQCMETLVLMLAVVVWVAEAEVLKLLLLAILLLAGHYLAVGAVEVTAQVLVEQAEVASLFMPVVVGAHSPQAEPLLLVPVARLLFCSTHKVQT